MLGVVGGASPPRVVDDGIVVPQLQGPLSGVGLDELSLEAAKATPAGKKSSLRLACKTLASKSFWHRPDDLGTQALGLELHARDRPRPSVNCRGGPSATRGRKQNGFASGQSRGPRRRGAGLPLTGDCAARLSTRRARLAQGQQPHVVEDPGPVRSSSATWRWSRLASRSWRARRASSRRSSSSRTSSRRSSSTRSS